MPDHSSDPTQWRHANPILEVADVQAAIAFYERVFSLVPTWLSEEENIGGVTTENAPFELYLERAERPTPSRLSVFVDDADATYAKCHAAGAEIFEEIETKPWGIRRFTVRDPDGNLIDISHQVDDQHEQPLASEPEGMTAWPGRSCEHLAKRGERAWRICVMPLANRLRDPPDTWTSSAATSAPVFAYAREASATAQCSFHEG